MENLEYRLKDFRERMIGKTLSDKYPLKFFKDGTIKHEGQKLMSDFDGVKVLSRLLRKLIIPYTGDKLMIEWSKLEGEINPKRKNEFLFSGYGFVIGKYGVLGIAMNHLPEIYQIAQNLTN